jgi:hypothetical protein
MYLELLAHDFFNESNILGLSIFLRHSLLAVPGIPLGSSLLVEDSWLAYWGLNPTQKELLVLQSPTVACLNKP